MDLYVFEILIRDVWSYRTFEGRPMLSGVVSRRVHAHLEGGFARSRSRTFEGRPMLFGVVSRRVRAHLEGGFACSNRQHAYCISTLLGWIAGAGGSLLPSWSGVSGLCGMTIMEGVPHNATTSVFSLRETFQFICPIWKSQAYSKHKPHKLRRAGHIHCATARARAETEKRGAPPGRGAGFTKPAKHEKQEIIPTTSPNQLNTTNKK